MGTFEDFRNELSSQNYKDLLRARILQIKNKDKTVCSESTKESIWSSHRGSQVPQLGQLTEMALQELMGKVEYCEMACLLLPHKVYLNGLET